MCVNNSADRAPGKDSCRVLIVEDNDDYRESLAELLSMHGYVTRTAPHGLAGLVVAREFEPHVILLDIGLPVMDGYEFARLVRTSPTLQDVVIAAVTGWGAKTDKAKAAAAGINFHLLKPADTEDVLEVLRNVTRPAR